MVRPRHKRIAQLLPKQVQCVGGYAALRQKIENLKELQKILEGVRPKIFDCSDYSRSQEGMQQHAI